MKKFIKKSLSLSVLFFLIYVLLLIITYFIEIGINKNKISDKIAMLGHSHIEFGLNDSLLSRKTGLKFINNGVGGQSLFWSIASAKKHKFQGVKNFIILVTNSSYTTGWKTFDKKRGEKEIYLKSFLEKDDFIYLFKNDFNFALRTLFKFTLPTKKIKGTFLKGDSPFNKQIVNENLNQNIDFNDSLLHKFINSNDASNFLIIRLPIHPDGFNYFYNENEDLFLEKLDKYAKYKNTIVVDYGNLFRSHPINPDSLFMDYGHLNFKGSIIVSEELSELILQKGFFKN